MASRVRAQASDRLDVRRSPTSKAPLRILIADDHEIVRRGVRTILSSHRGWEVCAEAATGREAVAKAEQHKPDIVVMDISMPELNGLEAARKIRKMLPNTEVVILSFHFSDQLVRDIVDAGAHAYILKSDADRDLVAAIEALANHRSFFSSRASEVLIDGFFKSAIADPPKHKRLTPASGKLCNL